MGLEQEITSIRQDFPALSEKVNSHPLCYLDNAATALKPSVVSKSIQNYYEHETASVHRGVHTLSQKVTEQYEMTRETVVKFIGAQKREEIIFTRGATEGINLLAHGLAESLGPQDEILISQMEHHSNLVPWQWVHEKTKAKLRYLPLTESGELDLTHLDELLNSKTKIVSLVHASNTLGTINPLSKIFKKAKELNAITICDATQSIPHFPVNVQELSCDFLVFSGHKTFGPTGVGVLYGRYESLDQLPPYHLGGGMIQTVKMEKTEYAPLPERLEAGTPPISEVIALKEAIDYLNEKNLSSIQSYEEELLNYTQDALLKLPGLRIFGPLKNKVPVISFAIDGVHPHDLGSFLDQYGVAIRTGHHCTAPIMQFYSIPATARASFAFYNTQEEADQLVMAIKKTQEFFQ